MTVLLFALIKVRISKKHAKKNRESFGGNVKNSTFAPEFLKHFAQVAELVDALDSKSSVLNRRAGSIPALSTRIQGVEQCLTPFFVS